MEQQDVPTLARRNDRFRRFGGWWNDLRRVEITEELKGRCDELMGGIELTRLVGSFRWYLNSREIVAYDHFTGDHSQGGFHYNACSLWIMWKIVARPASGQAGAENARMRRVMSFELVRREPLLHGEYPRMHDAWLEECGIRLVL